MSRQYIRTVYLEPPIGGDGRGSKHRYDPVMSEQKLKKELENRKFLESAKNALADRLNRLRDKLK